MSDQIPQVNQTDDELSVEELEEASGGLLHNAAADDINTNCGGNCGCTANP